MYHAIKENRVNDLRAIFENQGVNGLPHINFDFYPEDEEVLNLADGSKVKVTILNPVILAIKHKSFACLKYIIERSDVVRQNLAPLDVIIRKNEYELPFNHLILPVLLKVKDVDSLTFLLKQPGFYFT